MKNAIRYARNNDGQCVAYEVSGTGPLDLVFIPDWVTNLEVMREEPTIARFLDRLASFSRLICLDKRGSGLSDPVPLGAIPTIEEWMHDVCAVLDDLDSPRAVLFGHGEGGPMALLFAATHPDRTQALVLADTCARRRRAPDYPCGMPETVAARYIETVVGAWGSGEAARLGAPSEAHQPGFVERRGRHVGECEIMGEKVGGIAVHIAARIMAQSQPGGVLVSRTVKDLVAGSGLVFKEAGRHNLRGVAENWDLYFAQSRSSQG